MRSCAFLWFALLVLLGLVSDSAGQETKNPNLEKNVKRAHSVFLFTGARKPLALRELETALEHLHRGRTPAEQDLNTVFLFLERLLHDPRPRPGETKSEATELAELLRGKPLEDARKESRKEVLKTRIDIVSYPADGLDGDQKQEVAEVFARTAYLGSMEHVGEFVRFFNTATKEERIQCAQRLKLWNLLYNHELRNKDGDLICASMAFVNGLLLRTSPAETQESLREKERKKIPGSVYLKSLSEKKP